MKPCFVEFTGLGPRPAIADLMEDHGQMRITRINVPQEARGKGIGRTLLNQILAEADTEGVALYLDPLWTGGKGMGQRNLVKWYERNGFEWLGDPGASSMVRKAKT